jgi:phage repressor protein C with HTH and peptisase S24 domain
MGRREVYAVEGRSMWPTLEPGDLVFVDPARPGEIGDIVVAELMTGRKVVKRIASKGDRTVALGSDNPTEATDSRELGSLHVSNVKGQVVMTWPWR